MTNYRPFRKVRVGTFPYRCILWFCGVVILLSASVTSVSAQVLTADTVWKGTVTLSEDILVPKGVTLIIRPGTFIKVALSDSTKTDPEYISPLIELTVRGTLVAEGGEDAPIVFSGEVPGTPGSWAGMLVDGGSVSLRFCRIHDAENALQVFAGNVVLDRSVVKGNRYGLVAQGSGSRVRMTASTIQENDYGQLTLSDAEIVSSASTVMRNHKRDFADIKVASAEWLETPRTPENRQVARVYRDEVLLGETVWQGRIEVNGQVRIPESARLVILPGTVVEFRRRDTNGDGIGENGLLIQGVLIAKGAKAAPIRFRSAENEPRMGDWDSINIMNSDSVQNLIEYCQIEDSYRGLHFHFSNVLVSRSDFNNSYRGIQFQESQVDIRNSRFRGNKSAVQGRDSDLLFTGNLVQGNMRGVNFFRNRATITGNRFSSNSLDGLRIRDSGAVVERNSFDANRYGLMAQDSMYGRYAGNLVSGNAELGFSLKNIDNLEVSGNFVSGNGLNGMNLQEVRAVITNNSITDNGERGFGIISVSGTITRNNFAGNGLFAIDLEGAMDLNAPGNWWGGELPDKVIYDRLDEPGRGRVLTGESRATPLPFVWPLNEIPATLTWRGEVEVNTTLNVPPGVALTISPGTKVRMGADVSLMIRGKLLARGEKGRRISFTSIGAPEPGAWGEILFERATGSLVEYCDISAATWGLHSHFTNLSVLNSRITSNLGGIRFRSGPVNIARSLFSGNKIGIRSYRGIASITDNLISGNEIGIFVREKGGGLKIRRNNIAENSGYGIRIGDFNSEDVEAVENWWGKEDLGTYIFDARQESGIGYVRFDPALVAPINVAPEE